MLRRARIFLPAVAALMWFVLMLAPAGASAANVYNVSNTSDVVAADATTGCATADTSPTFGACTLRSAVQAANAATGASTINLAPGTYTLTIAPSGNASDDATGDLNILTGGAVTINGAGAADTVIDANSIDRAFSSTSGASLALSGVTVEHGYPGGTTGTPACPPPSNPDAMDDGGAILVSDGGLTLSHDIFTGNFAIGDGGAVADEATTSIDVTDTTFSDNTACSASIDSDDGNFNASGQGGGLFVDSATSGSPGTVSLSGDTFNGNVVFNGDTDVLQGLGGGIFASNEMVSLVNTTVTGNTAFGGGGMASVGATTTISYSTIDANTATGGTGSAANLEEATSDATSDGPVTSLAKLTPAVIASAPLAFTLDDSIVAGGIAPNGASTNCASASDTASFASNGHNLFDDTADSGAQCGAVASDVINASPMLGALAANGGPTQTQALALGSPAIDAADDSLCTSETAGVDQRGVARPQGPHCDIGAYERVSDTDLALSTTVAPGTIDVGHQATFTNTISNDGTDPATGVVFSDPVAGSTIGSATPSQGTCTHTATTVSCQLGALAVGAKATVSVVVTGTSTGTITLHGATSGDQTDPNPANNQTTTSVGVVAASNGSRTVSADLALTKRASRATVVVGHEATYTLTVHNRGPNTATDVTLTDRLPASTKRISVKVSHGKCSGSKDLKCTLGSLASGKSITVKVVVRMTHTGRIRNTAHVTESVRDPHTANNTAHATIHVVAPPCVENLVFTTGFDPGARVGTVKVYVDGTRTQTLHGHDLRRVKIRPVPTTGMHSVTVMFIIDPFETVTATRSYGPGCSSGRTTYDYPPQTNPGAS